jgi:hypothetical protein
LTGGWSSFTQHRGLLRVPSKPSTVAAHQERLAASEAWAWVESLRLSALDDKPLGDLAGSPLLGTVTELHLERVPGNSASGAWVEGVLGTPGLARLLSLSLHVHEDPAQPAGFVADATHLSGLVRLRLQGALGEAAVLRLASAPHLRRLRELEINDCDLGPDAAAALAESEMLAGLDRLELWGTEYLTGGAIAALFRAGRPRALTRLRLFVRAQDERAAVAGVVAAAPQLGGLRELDLGSCNLGDRGVIALAASPHLRRLEKLSLRHNDVGPDGCSALAASPVLAGVTDLDLGGNPIGPHGLAALAASPHASRLRSLCLFASAVGPEGCRALAASAHLGGLEDLNLMHAGVGDEGLEAIAGSPHLSRLTNLWLYGNGVGDRGVVALARSPAVARLWTLWLEDNAVGDAGARAIAESENLAALRRLNLDNNAVGSEGGFALASSPHLRHLTELALSGKPLSDEAVRALHDRFTDKVVSYYAPED